MKKLDFRGRDNRGMSQLVVSGIIGLAGSGKTTLAKTLKLKTYSFSTPVKTICAHILGEEIVKDKSYTINLGSIDFNFSGQGNLVKVKSPNPKENMIYTGREILQYIGTDYIIENFGKQFYKELWVTMLMCSIRCNPPERIVVIDDVRFKHEVKIIDRLTLVVTDGIKPLELKSEKLASKMTKAFRNGTFAKKYPDVKVVYNRRIDGEMQWANYGFYPEEGERYPDESKVCHGRGGSEF